MREQDPPPDGVPDVVRVLLVEDSRAYARLVELALSEGSLGRFDVRAVERLSQAEQVIHDGRLDVALLDLNLPDAHGLEAVQRVHELAPRLPIVVLTGHTDETLGLAAVREGAQDYLVKGDVQSDVLVRAIRYAIERRKAEADRELLVGELQEALDRVRRLSGLLPICAACKRIRDDRGYWTEIERYIQERSDASFSHGICPECGREA
ncbi:MAG: response regulator [Acidobacteria bacterium]|nr:response regulator [Acidobacteriota bacterium]